MHTYWILSALGIAGTANCNLLRREPSQTPAASSLTYWTPTTAAAAFTAPPLAAAASSSIPSSQWIRWPSSTYPVASPAPNPLSNTQQVGNSLLGSLAHQPLPQYIGTPAGAPYANAPWGECTASTCDGTNLNSVPVTNITRQYYFSVSRGLLSPDGVLRNVILVNGQFPGPLIQANWGDWIEVTVTNNIVEPEEGTSLHWHGLLQAGTQWMDGVPGVSQCPIAPGETYTYRFQATSAGTTMYHAHYSAQYTAGIVGPMVVYGPTEMEYDIDVGPVMLSDWQHIPYFSMVENVMTLNLTEFPPHPDSGLINGRGRFNCEIPSYGVNATDSEWLASNLPSNLNWTCVDGAQRSQFQFQQGKVHRLRVVNVGADGFHRFSIDGHTLTVIMMDYTPVTPYTVESVLLGVGQRVDVLVEATQTAASSWWMRSEILNAATCGGLAPPGVGELTILAGVYYEGADTTADPTSTSIVKSPSCDNPPLEIAQPAYSITPSTTPFYQDLVLQLTANASGSYEWTINGQTFRGDYNTPILYEAEQGITSFPSNPEWNVYNFADNSSVILNITNATPFPHPIHMHGHNFYVLSVGERGESWDGSVVNPSNPMRRDTQIVPALGYIAIQFEADNPGVWPLHCHVAWHLSGGWYINVMSQPELIQIPKGQRELSCKAWDQWSSNNVVDQIDSGS